MFQPAKPVSTLKIAHEKNENTLNVLMFVLLPALQFVLTNIWCILSPLTTEKALNYIHF